MGELTMEDLVNAVKIIREVCATRANCNNCPFGASNHRCLINGEVPEAWTIKDESNKVLI